MIFRIDEISNPPKRKPEVSEKTMKISRVQQTTNLPLLNSSATKKVNITETKLPTKG